MAPEEIVCVRVGFSPVIRSASDGGVRWCSRDAMVDRNSEVTVFLSKRNPSKSELFQRSRLSGIFSEALPGRRNWRSTQRRRVDLGSPLALLSFIPSQALHHHSG
jgi:hypothetical protein